MRIMFSIPMRESPSSVRILLYLQVQNSRTHTEAIESSVAFLVFLIRLRNLYPLVFDQTCKSPVQLFVFLLIQVHIPQNRSNQSFVFKMKCGVNSNTTHDVLINKKISYESQKEICSGEASVMLGKCYFQLYVSS